MPHPELSNLSPYACELLFVTNEEGCLVCVPLVQATFAITEGVRLTLLEKQPPINLAGAWWGDPASTSMKAEPQIAFIKPGTDIVLMGHAYPSNPERTEGMVGIRVGNIQKVARVFGDRWFSKRLGFTTISTPQPFDRIPITYERAFGGWDRRDPDAAKHSFEPRNPVGMGFRDAKQSGDAEWPLPNIEDPGQLIQSPGDRPTPAGFGFISPDWQPRATYAGTYDKTWSESRKPLLPKDFDRRFFNAGSVGLISQSPLAGDEAMTIIGASPQGRISFQLPGIAPPICRIMLKSGKPVDLQTALDTLVVDMDLGRVTLTWRAHQPVPRGIHEVMGLELPPQLPEQLDDED